MGEVYSNRGYDGQETLYQESREYVYFWGNNPVRKRYKGQRCRLIASGRMGSVLVEFRDSHRMITSRRAIRKVKP